MKPFEILSAARRENCSKTLHFRRTLDTFLAALPLSALARAGTILLLDSPGPALSCLPLLYIAYITFIRASSIAVEYDTGSACDIAIYQALAKWSILAGISLHVQSPYSLAFFINALVPDSAHALTLSSLLAGYAAGFAGFLPESFPVNAYPVGVFALSFLHFLTNFEKSSESLRRTLSLLLHALNGIFLAGLLSAGTLWISQEKIEVSRRIWLLFG
ncbi:uncharacterized protein NEMAJ01_2156 [Nematocida major]|uniref:uncharacterized protein n=1 Tax=Nematocida major TaxID=1912982 RepID=UPI0020086464|nr:uncharacterized protein NEMAJ01_2156 [Nematocida major]KAH9387260.1 hypothetical protein NEMAJ01_2156 [Nematocida major]